MLPGQTSLHQDLQCSAVKLCRSDNRLMCVKVLVRGECWLAFVFARAVVILDEVFRDLQDYRTGKKLHAICVTF